MKGFQWRKEKPTKGWVYPTSREGHTVTYISRHECLLLFGGLSNTRMNDLYLYDIKENMWKTQPTTGRSPSARCYHTAFYDETSDNYYIYGGQGDKRRSMSDFYFLNMKNWIWKKLFIQEIPPSRHHHIFTEMNPNKKERIIFGGYTLPENQLLNDVWTFDYSNLVSSSSLQDISGAKVMQITEISGDVPSPRRGMTSFNQDKNLIIFGGQTHEKEEPTNILYCLNYDTWVWSKIDCIGSPPPSRSFLSCSVFTNGRVLFFGGQDNETNQATNEVNILTLNDNYWSSPFQAGIKASPRYNHSSCMVSLLSGEKYLVVIGGLDSLFCPMELCILYETETDEKIEWQKVQEPSELDNIVSEQAGLTILDYKQQIDQLNKLIYQESQVAIELNDQHESLKNEEMKSIEENEEKGKKLEDELGNLKDVNQKYKDQMENMFMMIKQEQLLCKEMQSKNKLLEFIVQKLQDYLLPLDQFYTQLSTNKFDEKDSKEVKLKQIVEGAKDDVNKSRDLHKESLYRLKRNYEKIAQSVTKSEEEIEKNKKVILDINKQYEQIICETETEEQY